MIRSAMSVPTNIVEGRGQASDRDYCRFLRYSINSSSELENLLIMARDVEAIRASDYKSLRDQVIEVRKMLYGLKKSLSKPPAGPSPDGKVPAS
jgi:four helix bundle protein